MICVNIQLFMEYENRMRFFTVVKKTCLIRKKKGIEFSTKTACSGAVGIYLETPKKKKFNG